MIEPYEIDDRGNVVDFYSTESNDQIARLDREAEIDGKHDQKTWDGNDSVTAWAMEHGYKEEIEESIKI